MKKFLLVILVFAGFAAGQQGVTNTFNAAQFSGADAGTKIANAQNACLANTSIPCTIIIDSILAVWPQGTTPAKCSNCMWVDYRVPGTLSIPVTVSAFNSVQWIDGVINKNMAACYSALPASGGSCHVPPGYSETLSSSLTLSKNNAGFVFEGPATVNLGSNQIVVSQGVNGAFITSYLVIGGNPLGGGGSAGNTGITFTYTGSGTAIVAGGAQVSPATSSLRFYGFTVDLSGAGSSAIGIDLLNAHGGIEVRNVFVRGAGGATSQIGIQLDQGGNFTGDGRIEDCWFTALLKGINNAGGSGGLVQEMIESGNIFFAGGTSSTAIANDFTFSNWIFANTISSWTNAITYTGNSSGNKAEITTNGTTLDASYAAGATNNELICVNTVPCIVTDAGTNNLIRQSGSGQLNEQGSSGALTGNSADQTFYTYTLPARALPPGKCLEVEAWANHSTGTTSTTYKLFFGATAYVNNASTGSGQVYLHAHVCNNPNSITAQHGSTQTSFPTVAFQSFSPITSAEATSSTVVIKATFNVANTDQVTPGNFSVRMTQ